MVNIWCNHAVHMVSYTRLTPVYNGVKYMAIINYHVVIRPVVNGLRSTMVKGVVKGVVKAVVKAVIKENKS